MNPIMGPTGGCGCGAAGGSAMGGMAGSGMLNQLLSGDLAGALSSMLMNPQQAQAMLTDLKEMLGQLSDGMDKGKGEGAQQGGAGGSGGCSKAEQSSKGEGANGEGGRGEGGRSEEGRGGEGSCGCGDKGEDAGWDGKDKSPSLDREQAAHRLLEQAKNTDDPEQKQELVKQALEMLGDKKGCGGPLGQLMDQLDGNSYDKDVVKQGEKMLDGIENGELNGCSKGKALDNLIDMLTKEGGVDGKAAGNDRNGDGFADCGMGGRNHPLFQLLDQLQLH